jgi:penicillin-binding protein 1C
MRVCQVKRRWRWLAAFIFAVAGGAGGRSPVAAAAAGGYAGPVVVAEDGTPLWRFADAQGVWRYPVTLDDVSPRYLQALIQYEDRWFWRHPGNPFAVFAPPGRI